MQNDYMAEKTTRLQIASFFSLLGGILSMEPLHLSRLLSRLHLLVAQTSDHSESTLRPPAQALWFDRTLNPNFEDSHSLPIGLELKAYGPGSVLFSVLISGAK